MSSSAALQAWLHVFFDCNAIKKHDKWMFSCFLLSPILRHIRSLVLVKLHLPKSLMNAIVKNLEQSENKKSNSLYLAYLDAWYFLSCSPPWLQILITEELLKSQLPGHTWDQINRNFWGVGPMIGNLPRWFQHAAKLENYGSRSVVVKLGCVLNSPEYFSEFILVKPATIYWEPTIGQVWCHRV